MIDRLEQARKANEEISFSFGGDMALISVSWVYNLGLRIPLIFFTSTMKPL
jgi:hypothetical protein